MKTIFMYIYVVTRLFLEFVFIYFIPMVILFVPVLPILLIAFPMIFLNDKHWTCKPYLWYFKNVWMKYIKLIKI